MYFFFLIALELNLISLSKVELLLPFITPLNKVGIYLAYLQPHKN